MANKLKKSFVLLMIFVITMGLFVKVGARTPTLYDFGTWEGIDSISVNVEINSDAFVKLSNSDNDIDISNYIVSSKDGNTTITLKEEYLKTLKNGNYSYWGYFASEGIITYTQQMQMKSSTEAFVPMIAGSNNLKFVITYNGEIVEESNYTTTKTNGVVSMVTFKEEYINSLNGEYPFIVHMVEDEIVIILKLTVKTQDDSNITPGDINNDGFIDVEDLMMLKKHILRIKLLEGNSLKRANLTHESSSIQPLSVEPKYEPSVEDLLALKKIILKIT